MFLAHTLGKGVVGVGAIFRIDCLTLQVRAQVIATGQHQLLAIAFIFKKEWMSTFRPRAIFKQSCQGWHHLFIFNLG
jgi:hypothetical protein